MNNQIVHYYETEWPGWPLSENKYGHEFDEPARLRMIAGSKVLIPYIKRRLPLMNGPVLEVGPFFNPLLLDEEIRGAFASDDQLYFLENDEFAIDWLLGRIGCGNVINLDMNHQSFDREFYRALFRNEASVKPFFDSILISQVLNYVNYQNLLSMFYPVLRSKGMLFINNVIGFGIPQLFSDARPGSNNEIVEAAKKIGFVIDTFDLVPRQFEKEPEDRLILLLSKP
jgi:hypothetical protein